MNCLNCNAGAPEGQRFCTDECKAKYINNFLLIMPAQDVDDRAMREVNSRIFLTRAQQYMNHDQKVEFCDNIILVAQEMRYLLYTDMSQDLRQRQTKLDYDAKVKIREEVAARDTAKVQKTVAERELDGKKRAVRQSGEKLSTDGKCKFCKENSLAAFCKKECERKWKVMQPWMNPPFNMPEDVARKMVSGVSPDAFTDETPAPVQKEELQ